MKKLFAAAAVALWLVPSVASASERVGSAAVGALAGAVVLGPVGAIAGAAIGYTVGPAIANSWGVGSAGAASSGVKRSKPRQAERPAKPQQTAAQHLPLPRDRPTMASEARAESAPSPAANKESPAQAKPAAQFDAGARQVPH